MSAFSFWFRPQRLFTRLARYCHEKMDEAFDRELERDIEEINREIEHLRKRK